MVTACDKPIQIEVLNYSAFVTSFGAVLEEKAAEAKFAFPRGTSMVVEDELVKCAFAAEVLSTAELETPVLDWAFGLEGH
jgi:hypothetical protein